jgi:hypothetical protein
MTMTIIKNIPKSYHFYPNLQINLYPDFIMTSKPPPHYGKVASALQTFAHHPNKKPRQSS